MKQVSLTVLLGWGLVLQAACADELVRAAGEGNLAEVQAALSRGGDVNAQEELAGRTALMAAAAAGRLEVVKLLIDKSANLQAKDSGGWTALMVAVREERTDVVRALLEKGADPNVRDNCGWTPLMVASLEGQRDIVALLLERKADLNARCSDDRTALMYAVGNDHIETVKLLLTKGADFEVTDANGWTVLMYAKKNANERIMEMVRGAMAGRAQAGHTTPDQEAAPPSRR